MMRLCGLKAMFLEALLPLGDFELRQAFTPQPEVLAHPAVKMFLSHCGWGGVTET